MKPDARLDSLTRSLLDQQQNTSAAIFLHIAKPFYLASDRLWFSGYVLDPSTGELAATRAEAQEEAIHVELVSSTNRRVEHQWIPVRQGRLSGSFTLADTLAGGTYRLLAYITDGVHRDRPAFERTLTLVNPSRPLSSVALNSAVSPTTADSLDVQGLPEGGRWVRGLPGRVGIKVVDRSGRGRSLSGQVVTAGGAAIPFSTNQLGMGSLNLTPGPNQPYYYQLNSESGSSSPPVASRRFRRFYALRRLADRQHLADGADRGFSPMEPAGRVPYDSKSGATGSANQAPTPGRESAARYRNGPLSTRHNPNHAQ